MSIFCCYAKQDVTDANKHDSADELTKENDTEIVQSPSLVSNPEIVQAKDQPLEVEVEVEVDNFPIEEKESTPDEEEYGVKSEYIPIVYDSVTNTMEEFIEPQIPYNGNLQEGNHTNN